MASGFTFLGEAVGHKNAALVNASLVAVGITFVGIQARRALSAAQNKVLPEDRFSCRMIFEAITNIMIVVGDMAMGKENRKYLPFVASLFTFLLIINFLGLLPGFILSSDHFQFDAGIALVVFTMYNFWGVKELGIKQYLAHFWIPGKPESKGQFIVMFFVGFILFPLELVSHAIRPLTLSLRIFGNMVGDHNLIGAFNGLVDGGMFAFVNISAFPFYFLGTIVCFIQAFIFALLTMVYIRLAVAH